ncbi:MAG TPA: glycosyltransferase, partial [Candidatus Saccharimonadales bacterium]
KYGVELEKIKVIPNGVEEKFYYDKPRTLHKKPRLLFVGRLDIQKNVQLLLNALDGISEQFETTIVGEGSLSSDLRKMAKGLKLKNIKFVGRKDDKELLNYYRRSDIFVLPSEREGMPLVLLEAMAMGLPIVATNVTGSRDVVKNGKNGYLVPIGNVESFRSALLKITSNKSTYKKLSQTSRKMADKYSWEKISAQFEKLYNKNRVSLKEQSLTKLKLWHILLPFLVVANASYLLKDFLGWIPTLCFFLFIPGFLLFNLLKHEIKSRWIIASFSLGLSLLLLMVGGLVLNELHVFGLASPLVTGNIFIMLDVMTLVLLMFNNRKPFIVPKIKLHLSKELVTIATLLTLLPLLAIGGAMRLNNGASNILTMILFASVAILFVLLAFRKSLKPIYPYALFMMAVAVLFSTSLRGWYITGHDIHHEFSVFQAVSNSGIWHVKNASKDPYNACLSITILPTIIAKITTISAPYVYKVVFQIIFALGIVPVYYFIKGISTTSKALLGAFIFISFPTFLNDMPFLNRQEIAFVLFALLLLTTFTKMARTPKTILTLLLVVGVLLSHYSTNYVMLALIVLSWGFYKALMYKRKNGKAFYMPLLSLPIILFALIATYMWGTVMTQTAPSIQHTIKHGIHTLTSKTIIRSTAVQYSLFTPASQSSKSEFQKYVGKNASQAHYVSPEISPITRLGRMVSRVINVENLNNLVHSLIAKIYQVLLLVGIVLSSILYFRRRKKELSHKDMYLFSLVLSSLVLLILLTVLPSVSVDYSVTRLFQQTLIITALPIIIATEFIFGFLGRYRKYAVIALFALLFLDLSGFIPQATGGFLPQLSLNNSGQYYDFFYTHKSDVVGVQWLEENRNLTIPIFEDTDSSAPIQGYYHKIGLINNKSSSG